MKKLSLLLITLLICSMSWAALVPNILATDLRCTPHSYENKYTFSFNTNHKPTKAYIRFYLSYDDMKNSLNVVNADNFNGTNANKPAFYYEFTSTELKQGEMKKTFGGVGGKTDANGKITNDCLPPGVLYWSVYVEADKGTEWGKIYHQPNSGNDTHHRLHATVNNYPETDGFGHIYATQYNGTTGDKGLMDYSVNPSGTTINNRYSLVQKYTNPTSGTQFTNQRRPAVAPDGKVYIADHGATNFNANSARPMMFTGGGIYVWDPNKQTGSSIVLQQFLNDATETSSGVTFWTHSSTIKMYGTNTYGEFGFHLDEGKKWKGYEYNQTNQANTSIYGWNGFKEYTLGSPTNPASKETTATTIQRSLGMGDGNGNISIAAMDKGVWMVQHRENDVQKTIEEWQKNKKKAHALPDNLENYLISFVAYGQNTRTWRSCTTKGINYTNKVGEEYTKYNFDGASDLTQKTTSPVQSAPGAGMTYRKIDGVDYIFMVQHTGDIAQLKVTWSGSTPTVTHYKTYTSAGTKTVITGTSRKTGAITSMCFDYAGNLVTTSGATYFGHSQDIIVYALPYNRTNAREIQAPNSCRMIPERISHEGMSETDFNTVVQPYITGTKTCPLDIYRPMQAGSFNTICLPFDVSTLAGTPYAGAEVMSYIGTEFKNMGGENVLIFHFEKVTSIQAGVPYLIQPKTDIVGIASFKNPIQFTTTIASKKADIGDFYADFHGVFLQTDITNPDRTKLMLISDNRLAEIEDDYFFGFRGYFELQKALPANTLSLLKFRNSTSTDTHVIVDGKKVNIQKFLRDGRIYIRMGETLYTLNGEVVSE
ncbi:MAG: hypothetical protein J6R26_03115 [Paludibacteraceae bacterium]|nr:hypothetical protein [Paludibacteraceae bacterium]